jgi:hypothetical protein
VREHFISGLNSVYVLSQLQKKPDLCEIINLVDRIYRPELLHRTFQQVTFMTTLEKMRTKAGLNEGTKQI